MIRFLLGGISCVISLLLWLLLALALPSQWTISTTSAILNVAIPVFQLLYLLLQFFPAHYNIHPARPLLPTDFAARGVLMYMLPIAASTYVLYLV